MRLRGSMLSLGALAALAACSNNGYVTFRGALLVPPAGQQGECRLSLPQFKDTPDEGDYTREIHGQFQQSFPIDAQTRDYEVEIACAGYEPLRRTVHLDQGEFGVDLGNLVLEKR
ncbi:hypothetical protein LF41_528 [Lysobacter dokdonensis DS-58]|uniref:Lipoprotein n=1 Tax=Lysobacter dokdonensis DS-58 TaxID=1300345 RepID=A0A0A2WFH6_9GAMM|nr:hypothetical protein [Lysobacter dokdonensis]KGQ18503.1 hypothetical protein LF41_528 [Lysobacter dokdonensis DS-58]